MATLDEMLHVAGSIENAEKLAKSLGSEYVLDHQLCLAAQGKWLEASIVNSQRPKNTPRDIYASGLFSVMSGDLPKGIFEMHRGREDGLFGQCQLLHGALFNPAVGSLQDKVVLLRGEGGLGDEIINARFAKNLADSGAKVIASCSKSLMPVFQRIEGVYSVVERQYEHTIKYDYWLPAMSAPGMLNIHHADLSGKPYLTATQESIDTFKQLMGEKNGLRIGIKWVGNPKFEHEQHRRFPLELLLDAVKGHDVWSLDISQKCPDGVKDATHLMTDWDMTLGALSNLDLLITSCTSLAHASGALGIPTWVVVPVMPYYTWAYPINKDSSPWYDSITLFRQEKFRKWDEPFNKIKSSLLEKVKRGAYV